MLSLATTLLRQIVKVTLTTYLCSMASKKCKVNSLPKSTNHMTCMKLPFKNQLNPYIDLKATILTSSHLRKTICTAMDTKNSNAIKMWLRIFLNSRWLQ